MMQELYPLPFILEPEYNIDDEIEAPNFRQPRRRGRRSRRPRGGGNRRAPHAPPRVDDHYVLVGAYDEYQRRESEDEDPQGEVSRALQNMILLWNLTLQSLEATSASYYHRAISAENALSELASTLPKPSIIGQLCGCCVTNQADLVSVACGHVYMCSDCRKKQVDAVSAANDAAASECPICRESTFFIELRYVG